MPELCIKILSINYPERYAVRRLVTLVQQELQAEYQDLQINITEVNDAGTICKYASMLILPTLVINEKVACSGRLPSKEEVAVWFREAVTD